MIAYNQKFGLKVILLIFMLLSVSAPKVSGQADTVKKKFRNTVKINITNPMIFGDKCNIIGYERVIKKNQTLSIGFGRFGMPKFAFLDLDSMSVTNQYSDKGFNFAIDYRFYLKKENKYEAPRGVYIGPYYGYNSFSRQITWNIETASFSGSTNTKVDMTANLIGFQMGYQFILWNRVSLDMVLFGPGYWFLSRKVDFGTSLPAEEEAVLIDNLNQMIKDKFPESELVIKSGTFSESTSSRKATMGFRYMINIGFRF